MTFTKSDKEKIYIESMTYLKNNDFGFEGSGTESSRRLIPIFLEDSVTVLEETNHIKTTQTTEEKR